MDRLLRGISSGATLGQPRKPHEFVFLHGRPSAWTPLDTIGVVKLISFTLAANWDVELARLKMLMADGPERWQRWTRTIPTGCRPPSRRERPLVSSLTA